MRIGRTIKWVLILLVIALAGGGGGFYWMLSRVPAGYEPAHLNRRQRLQVANTVFPRDVSKFHNIVQAGHMDTYALSQERINEYLASLDEIATELGHARPGLVHEKLQRMGLSEPAMDLRPGAMVFMVRSTKYEKVVSMEIGLVVEGRDIRASVDAVRVGSMPVPRSMVRDQLARVGGALGRLMARDDASDSAAGDVWDAPASVLPAVLEAAIDGKPLPAAFEVRIMRGLRSSSTSRWVRIRKIEIDDDDLRLWLEPLDAPPPTHR
jgi:hypothetical protein